MGLQPGDRFGRYELVSRLGHGGMAETWRAKLLAAAGITKPVLIKRILPEYASDDAFISMFISEARISATLSHGNIAQVHDFGELDGEYFLAMEFVDGKPLDRIIQRTLRSGLTALPTPLAIFITIEMCRGLHYAHTRVDDSGKPLGIVHRDISPDNVLVSYEGQVKLVDFGIAKARMQRNFHTAPGMVKGKYLFFSPEQARGEEVDGRTDVWATGIVLYELLCGRLPVEGPEYVALPKLINGAFPRPGMLRPDLPPKLEALVLKALALKRENRFESSHAFGDALNGYLYSSTPGFSAMSLSHFVQNLFREELTSEGRAVQVPTGFLEEMERWRSVPTAPSRAHVPATDPQPRVETDAVPEESFGPTKVPLLRRHSRKARMLLAAAAIAGLAFAGVRFRPDRPLVTWWESKFPPAPKVPDPEPPTEVTSNTEQPTQPSPPPETPATTQPIEGQAAETPPSPEEKPAGNTEAPEEHASEAQSPQLPPEEPATPSPEISSAKQKAAWALAVSGRTLLRQSKYAEASATFLRCLELDPGNGECRRLYANVLLHLGEQDRAKEQMRQFLHNPPSERPPDAPSQPLAPFSGH